MAPRYESGGTQRVTPQGEPTSSCRMISGSKSMLVGEDHELHPVP